MASQDFLIDFVSAGIRDHMDMDLKKICMSLLSQNTQLVSQFG
jgi:hypothetical protein